jgi:hypothetical protein
MIFQNFDQYNIPLFSKSIFIWSIGRTRAGGCLVVKHQTHPGGNPVSGIIVVFSLKNSRRVRDPP